MIIDQGTFRIIGAIRLAEFYPAFALAVAISDRAPGYWLQVQGPNTHHVIGFAPLAETDESDIVRLVDNPISVGDDYVHAFVNKTGGLLLGSVDALRLELGIAMRDVSTAVSVRLDISEHLGDTERIRDLRAKLAASVACTFGQTGAITFGDSAARSRLWEMVQGAAANPGALARIRKARPRLLAHVDKYGGITIDLSALDPLDLTVNFSDIAARMQDDFGGRLGPERLKRADLSGLSDVSDPTGQTIVEAMTRSPRQEERLAILFRAMILNPEAAERAIGRYKDPAIMASMAIDRLAGAISALRATPEGQRPQRLAPEIQQTIKAAYPRRRGAMLYYLAEHLSDFPPIERLLRSTTAASRAQAVSAVRSEILKALDRRNSRISH